MLFRVAVSVVTMVPTADGRGGNGHLERARCSVRAGVSELTVAGRGGALTPHGGSVLMG